MKNIIFDFGGVLVHWNPDLVYKPYFEHDEKTMQRFYDETNIFLANREMDRGRPFDEVLAELAVIHPHYQKPISCWKEKWREMIGGVVDGSVKILQILHRQGYPLYGLTNWSEETFSLVRTQYDFFNCFRDIVVSGKVKEIKPEPAIYKILLTRNQLRPEECLFIDDSPSNVETAKNLGMKGIIFKNPKQLTKELKKLSIIINL